jgi:hypothetical protein
MKKLVSTEPTHSNIARIIELLADSPEKLESLSNVFSNEQLHQPLGSGERSFTETLYHFQIYWLISNSGHRLVAHPYFAERRTVVKVC